jgi:hypothetical protein
MYQQLWGYKVDEKLYLGVREQKRLNTIALEDNAGQILVKSLSTHKSKSPRRCESKVGYRLEFWKRETVLGKFSQITFLAFFSEIYMNMIIQHTHELWVKSLLW